MPYLDCCWYTDIPQLAFISITTCVILIILPVQVLDVEQYT